MTYDLAVVGAGILGLAHALAAARRGLKVIVIDKDEQANGASIRNFGFITVTGQERGACWNRAMRSRDVWVEVAPQAGIPIEQRGLVVAARRPEAAAVLESFLATEMGEGCRMLSTVEAAAVVPALKSQSLVGALWSGHEIRVESRDAIPKLAAWLEAAHGVTFRRSTHAKEVIPPLIETTRGSIRAERAVICPGDDFLSLYPERIAAYGVTKCKLQMLRVETGEDAPRLGTAMMSDLGLVRYLGYSALPEAGALKARLQSEQANSLAHGIHLIAVQSRDGSLVVGDSHHYGTTPDPFSRTDVDQLIMDEFNAVLDFPAARITERWTGIYASAPDRLMFVDRPSDAVRLAMVTSGTGASTSFAIAEETIQDLFP